MSIKTGLFGVLCIAGSQVFALQPANESAPVKIFFFEEEFVELTNVTDLESKDRLDRVFASVLVRAGGHSGVDRDWIQQIETRTGGRADSKVISPRKHAIFGFFSQDEGPIFLLTLYEEGIVAIAGFRHVVGEVYQAEKSEKWYGTFTSEKIVQELGQVLRERKPNPIGK